MNLKTDSSKYDVTSPSPRNQNQAAAKLGKPVDFSFSVFKTALNRVLKECINDTLLKSTADDVLNEKMADRISKISALGRSSKVDESSNPNSTNFDPNGTNKPVIKEFYPTSRYATYRRVVKFAMCSSKDRNTIRVNAKKNQMEKRLAVDSRVQRTLLRLAEGIQSGDLGKAMEPSCSPYRLPTQTLSHHNSIEDNGDGDLPDTPQIMESTTPMKTQSENKSEGPLGLSDMKLKMESSPDVESRQRNVGNTNGQIPLNGGSETTVGNE